jgi:hypothetical protein
VDNESLNVKSTVYGVKQNYPISVEEEQAIEALGGIDRAAAIADQILARHGFLRGLFTKRERDQIRGGRRPQNRTIKFHFDPGKSLRANINDLLDQATELQTTGGGTNYVGAMLQHLVGAKLDIVLGLGKIKHHGFSVADQSTARQSDFQIETVAIHVTTHPNEALVRKSAENLSAGLRPLIITLGAGVEGASFLLSGANLSDRVDVLDVGQFLTANVYERSLFKTAACKVTFSKLLDRYNEIVARCETDPVFRIVIKSDAE